MPLLKKKIFEKATVPEYLRDDEEVFHCEITNEIFRDYDEYCQRIILCNSMVWSCSLSGKSGLTYAEALESEENARRSLRDFPKELQVPVLFLASKTKRTALGDMTEDVFMFVKDHYFIGEKVEAAFSANKWKESRITQVFAPTESEVLNAKSVIPGSLFKYQVEQIDADDEDISEVMILDSSSIHRKKALYTREKNKLFLKQYATFSDKGLCTIKDSVLKDYGVDKIKFEQIFDGPIPEFETLRKPVKVVNGKKVRQETLAKFLSRNGLEGAKSSAEDKSNLLAEMKKKEEAFKERRKQMQQEIAEKKQAEKQKRYEENVLVSKHLRHWYKPKEDLELEDQKELPEFTPVKCKIPDKYLGDVFMILEFVKSFSSVLQTKKFFYSTGLTFDLMERALTENEVAGPLIDIFQMLLNALFDLQEKEATKYHSVAQNYGMRLHEAVSDRAMRQTIRLATRALEFSVKHQGFAIEQLPMYPLTVSEILRLHLLSSGAHISDAAARWRYQDRGYYTSTDDPGLHLRLHHPHILRALSHRSVVELPLDYKLKLLCCLIYQMLTFPSLRNLTEERREQSRNVKLELRSVIAAERSRDNECRTTKYKLKRLKKTEDGDKALTEELENLKRNLESKRLENERKIEKLTKDHAKNQVMLGYDRAFRRYLRISGIPGIFINWEDPNPGTCYDDIVHQNKKLVGAGRTDVILHIRKICEEFNASDKENNPKSDTIEQNGSDIAETTPQECDKLLMCSADPKRCVLHSREKKTCSWYFVHDHLQIDELIGALNKRGARESELQQILQDDRDSIASMVIETDIAALNPDVDVNETAEQKALKVKKVPKKYTDANLGYPDVTDINEILHLTIIDYILDLEDKLYAGSLGTLQVKDRDEWRKCLLERNYDKMDRRCVTLENAKSEKVEDDGDTSRSSTPSEELDMDVENPEKFLPLTPFNAEDPNGDVNPTILENSDKETEAIHALAIALVQVGESIKPKFLKAPLGVKDKKSNTLRFVHWAESLLSATSFSQLFLHYSTLDTSVCWSRSLLKLRCRKCSRTTDPDQLLLCDDCSRGIHLYCLKPPLKSVPSGNWYCQVCQQKRDKKEKKTEIKEEEPEPPKKKKRIFKEESEDDVATAGDGMEMDTEDSAKINGNGMVLENGNALDEVCDACNVGGELLCCDNCPSLYHLECVNPPLRRVPRGVWHCTSCKEKKENRRSNRERRHSKSDSAHSPGLINNQRSCAARAQLKIQGFIKSLRRMSESEDTDGEETPTQRRSHRREDNRDDLPLHNAALHQLLTDVMKHEDAWPFIRPVQKNEVPDYYEIIAKPMDFGTIKYKLNMGEYQKDADFMADAVLVFENCNTYNNSDAEVYRCGVRLLKHFEKKSKELGLQLPEEMEDDDEPKTKKKRTKQ